jgi:RNA polymerase sigma-70 factor, ECF subfamily
MVSVPHLRRIVSGPEPSDIDGLVSGVQRGSRTSKRRLFEEHGPLVHRILLRTLGPDRDLADITHDAFIRIFESLPSLSDSQALTAWIMCITTRVAIDVLRARKRKHWLRFFAPEELPEAESLADDDENRAALRALDKILDRLSAEERVAFSLRQVEGLPLAEVAKLTECSLATVKRRVGRAQQVVAKHCAENELLSRWVLEDTTGDFDE